STSPDGTYEIQYSPDHLESGDTNRAGFVVEAYGPSQRILVASAIQYGLASTRTVDLVLPDSERGPSEYERYLASIQPILKDVSLGQLHCGEDDQDLTYLSGASGVPRDRLEMMVAAEQMARMDGYSHMESAGLARQQSPSCQEDAKLFTSTMFYAWMRLGEPPEREQILADSPAKLVGILKEAGEDNLIPALPAKDLEATESALVAAHTARVLQPSREGAPATLGDALNLLTGSNALSDHQKGLIAQLTVNLTPGPAAEEILKTAKLTPAQTGSLRQIVALHQLSEGDGPLIQAAHRHVLGKSEDTTLPLHAIAGLDESDWQHIVKNSESEVTDPAEIAKTATSLVERTAELLPNAFLLSRT